LASKNPDQTISVKSAYDLFKDQTTNLFQSVNLADFIKRQKPAFDFKHCMIYTLKNFSQLNYSRLANFNDSNIYCHNEDTGPLGQSLFLQNDQQVASILKLYHLGKKNFLTFGLLMNVFFWMVISKYVKPNIKS
jgi:hypothetical protein